MFRKDDLPVRRHLLHVWTLRIRGPDVSPSRMDASYKGYGRFSFTGDDHPASGGVREEYGGPSGLSPIFLPSQQAVRELQKRVKSEIRANTKHWPSPYKGFPVRRRGSASVLCSPVILGQPVKRGLSASGRQKERVKTGGQP